MLLLRSARARWGCVTLLLAFALSSCKCAESPSPPAPPEVSEESAFANAPANVTPRAAELPKEPWDLPRIRERGTLRILIEGGDAPFLPRHGAPLIKDRELAEAFAHAEGLTPEFVLVDDFTELWPALKEGRGDVIAAQLTVTEDRQQEVAFTWALETVAEWVVGRRGAPGLPTEAKALAGREVHVRRSSSYAQSLLRLREEGIDLQLVDAPESADPEVLAYDVTRGERPLTVVDSHMLPGIAAYNPDLQPLFKIAEGQRIAWAVRKDATALLARMNAFLVERTLTEHTSELFTGDLEQIRKRGVLRVLTRNNPVTYFMWRGEAFGFDYELMKLVADELGVRLAMVVPPSREELIPWLLEGRGDVIAASMTATTERAKKVRFTRPYLFVDEVLVKRSGDQTVNAPADLAGKSVHVRPSSSYSASLTRLKQAIGPFEIVAAPEELETAELVDKVGAGELPYTVADSHILDVELTWRDDVAAAFKLPPSGVVAAGDGAGEGQHRVAFAVRPKNARLHAFLEALLEREYRGLRYNMAKKRYFENKRQISRAVEDRLGKSGRISPYDEVLKKYARRYGLDWRLVAAQAFQESRFDPKAKSWVGARGLMQVMPATGKELGFTDLEDPDQGTHAGVAYLARLVRGLDPKIPFKQRLRFGLAAYNVGIGHVADARRVAAERGLDPNRWFGHVEKAMLLLEKPEVYRKARYGYCRGSEPVKYVSNIQLRYDHLVALVD